jgi:DeoR/GlpR family transcriptional regulator of sugar metabolism
MGEPGRITTFRRQRLLDQLEQQGTVRVADLAATFRVSDITIRRDLDELAGQGRIERFHGGARLAGQSAQETNFEDKGRLHTWEKDAIGAAAAELVKDEDTVFLNAGSTTLSVLRHLRRRSVRVVTNNAAAPAEIGGSNVELILLGGEFRPRSCSLFGDLTMLALAEFHASVCILGTNGVSVRTGLTTSVYAEAAINRLMAQRCEGDVVVVADGSKVGATSSFACVPLPKVKVLITDGSADSAEVAAIRGAGVRVVVVEPPTEKAAP